MCCTFHGKRLCPNLKYIQEEESKMSNAMIAHDVFMPVWSFSKDTGVDKHGVLVK